MQDEWGQAIVPRFCYLGVFLKYRKKPLGSGFFCALLSKSARLLAGLKKI
jgi:hypothetical protein